MRLDPLSGFSLSIIKFSKTDQILSGIYEVDERPKRAVVKTYPFFIMVRIVVIYIFYVSSLHETQKRQQRTSLLERGENRRVSSGKVVQRQVLYLGEIKDSQ